MPKSKLSAFLSLVFVFASGALVGAVAHRLFTANPVIGIAPGVSSAPGRKGDPEEFKRHMLAEMKDKIKLSDQQVSQVEQIMDQTREQFDQLRRTMNEKMKPSRDAIWQSQVEQTKEILRPDQLPLYEKFRADRDAERKKNARPGPSGSGSK
jgi:Spy/CpxP family protein refolding chaperone